MVLFREKISEEKAVAHFVISISEKAKKDWPAIKNNFKEIFNKEFEVDDEKIAIFDLVLASIALDLQVAINIFPIEQSERLVRLALKMVNTENEYGDYAIREIKNYNAAFHNHIEFGKNPLEGVAILLLRRWFGKKIQKYYVKVGRGRYLSPILIMFAIEILVPFTGFWKGFNENYKLIKSDLPL